MVYQVHDRLARGVVRQLRMDYTGKGSERSLGLTQSVRFLDIGRPEKITAPRHYTDQVTHG